MVPASVGFQCPECVSEGRRSVRPARTMYGGSLRRGGVDVTRVLIGINVVIFLITAASGAGTLSGGGTSSIYDRFALIPTDVADGDWYRLVSSMFLHYGIFHIAFNMWALYVIGSPLEAWLGRLRFVVLYFLAGIGGGILSFATGPLVSQAAGASGAIFGLFGAFFVISRRRGLETGGIVGLIVINLVLSFTVANIDWRGHVGGLVVGALVGIAFAWAPAGPQRDRVQALGCLGVALVLTAAGFAGARHVQDECKAPTTGSGFAVCANAGFTPGG
jgi:membrane associated rhomboid family serine protease